MTWTCERGEFCREATIDPFTGENLGPRPPVLLWPAGSCLCGARLAGAARIVGECRECAEANSEWAWAKWEPAE